MLKAVLFDIDDTLFPTSQFALQARRDAVSAMVATGLQFPEEIVLAELLEVITEFSSNYDHHFNKLLNRLDPKGERHQNPALIVAAGVAAYHDSKFHNLRPFGDVVPLMEYIRARGWLCGIVTQGWTTKQAEKLIRLGVVPYLDRDAIFISDTIGINKPNPKLYQLAARSLDLVPSQVMYVGDNPDHDLAPALKLGMAAVWAKRSSKWQGDDVDATHIVDDFVELREILEGY
ncbi:MAG: HAD-IA family hydrolase [Planctomycetota bacterium]|nr:HAD-IA family hydrolase [Planctomycetota bacterium]MDG2143530.1 HAD-IA family hydrolase [Planctomycetota bacterium]